MLKRIVGLLLAGVLLFSASASVSAVSYYRNPDLYFSEDFTNKDRAWNRLIFGEWLFNDGGGIYGHSDAKVIQTVPYNDDDMGLFRDYSYEYLDYDATITLSVYDDTYSDKDRFVNLVYVNDNFRFNNVGDSRVMMAFSYDFQENCFRFTEGWSQTDPELQIMSPVCYESWDEDSEFHTLGMTVEKGRVRCFFDGEMIFDFIDEENKYYIANKECAPVLFWQDGNFVQVKNISVDKPGYLLESSYKLGDSNCDGSFTLLDVTVMLQQIAKWDNVDINVYAADLNRDRELNLADVTELMRILAKFEIRS